MIRVEHIFKTYEKGTISALQDVSLEVRSGELFGLIGPDGAGKTSLFRILTTVLLADSGIASVDELDVVKDYKQIRQRVGYMPGRFSLYQDLSVEENLHFFASIFKTTVKENYDLIRDIYVQLEPFRKRKAGALSGGMKQKLALCCALVHKPTVLFLDEPTTGVDPVSRKEFWNMLKSLQKQEITIMVSTPYMDEAELCDRIALIQDSKILSIDTPGGILSQYQEDLWAVKGPRMYPLLRDLRAFEASDSCYAFGENHHLTLRDKSLGATEILQYLHDKGHEAVEVKRISPSIEDCFMALMET